MLPVTKLSVLDFPHSHWNRSIVRQQVLCFVSQHTITLCSAWGHFFRRGPAVRSHSLRLNPDRPAIRHSEQPESELPRLVSHRDRLKHNMTRASSGKTFGLCFCWTDSNEAYNCIQSTCLRVGQSRSFMQPRKVSPIGFNCWKSEAPVITWVLKQQQETWRSDPGKGAFSLSPSCSSAGSLLEGSRWGLKIFITPMKSGLLINY